MKAREREAYSLRKISLGRVDADAGLALGNILFRIEQRSDDPIAIQAVPNEQSTEFVLIFSDRDERILFGGVVVKGNTRA